MDHELLERLPVPVEGLLAEIGGAGAEVGVRSCRGEVEQFEAVPGEMAGDLGQALADVAHGADGSGRVGIAAQDAEVDQTTDYGPGLILGRPDLAELRHAVLSVAAAAAQPAADGGLVDAHAVRFEPTLQLGDGGARVVQRGQFVRVAVEAGAGAAESTPRPVSAFRDAASATASKVGLLRGRDKRQVSRRAARAAFRAWRGTTKVAWTR